MNTVDRKLVIFTDLDGTLLDSFYSHKKAVPALHLLRTKQVPLIFCSSKTRSEIIFLRKRLGNLDPFISENGGGIFIPRQYFKTRRRVSGFRIQKKGDYDVIKLGADYAELRHAVSQLRSEGFNIKGFGDMDIKQIADLTGMSKADAGRAKEREFDEPFIFHGGERQVPQLKRRISAKGFRYTQGEFFHIMGDSDKGRAVKILTALYSSTSSQTVTAALGDNRNDVEMLMAVDYPIIVRKEDGSYDKCFKSSKLIRADGIGPDGWNRAVIALLETLLL